MKPMLLLSACGLALMGAAACAPTTPATPRVALECPKDVGDLTLSNMAADKKSCAYSTRSGDQVSLRLMAVSTTYEAALQPVEQELQAEQSTQQDADKAKVEGAEAEVKAAKASSAGAAAAAAAAKQATDDAVGEVLKAHKDESEDSQVSIGKGGVSVGSGGHGDHANIDLPGIHISADDDKANVNVGGGMVNVEGGEDGATIRVERDVRLRGEALSRERRGFRATYILAKDNLKDGWKAVGYEAAGPKSGPIAVAVFKAREGASTTTCRKT